MKHSVTKCRSNFNCYSSTFYDIEHFVFAEFFRRNYYAYIYIYISPVHHKASKNENFPSFQNASICIELVCIR